MGYFVGFAKKRMLGATWKKPELISKSKTKNKKIKLKAKLRKTKSNLLLFNLISKSQIQSADCPNSKSHFSFNWIETNDYCLI